MAVTLGTARADIETDSVELIDLGSLESEVSTVRVSANGRFATVNVSLGARDFVHVELDTGVVTDVVLDFPVPSEDGLSVTGREMAGDGTLLREDLVTGELTPAIPSISVPDELDLPRYDPKVLSSSGNFLLIGARSDDGFASDTILWDNERNVIATDTTFLPRDMPLIAGAGFNTIEGRSVVTYWTYSVVGAVYSTREIIDLETLQRTTIQRPDAHSALLGAWSLSANHEWIVFRSDQPAVIPGLDDTPRVYRLHRPTGATEAVAGFDLTSPGSAAYRLLDNGTVIFEGPAEDRATTYLYAWSGGNSATQLLRSVNGGPSDQGLASLSTPWAVTPSGNTIVFVSWASDLVDETGPEQFVRRLYRIGRSDTVTPPTTTTPATTTPTTTTPATTTPPTIPTAGDPTFVVGGPADSESLMLAVRCIDAVCEAPL